MYVYYCLIYLQQHADFCEDTLAVYAILYGNRQKLNLLHHRTNALIMVEDEDVQIVLTSCDRTSLQTARGFLAHVTYLGNCCKCCTCHTLLKLELH